MKPKLGQIVFVTMEGRPDDPRLGKEVIHPTFPAIVHQVFDSTYIGVNAFTDSGAKLLRTISYNEEKVPNTWRFEE